MRYMKGTDAYIAVVQVKTKVRNGSTGQIVDAIGVDRIGPYDTVGAAKGQVTLARKDRKGQFVDGWVEVTTGWERIDD